MKTAASGWMTVVVAAVLVVGVTVVQGMWTERWGRRDDGGRLREAAGMLEKVFPDEFGEWMFEQELESSARELERAGAVGHVSKLYRNTRTSARVSAFVVCAIEKDVPRLAPCRLNFPEVVSRFN